MDDVAPIVEIRAQYVDEIVAREAAEALNVWFRWILDGSEPPPPEALEPFGVDTADYAWALAEDVDWQLGPHARALGGELRIALQTHDTHLRLSGLLRAMGARSVQMLRDDEL